MPRRTHGIVSLSSNRARSPSARRPAPATMPMMPTNERHHPNLPKRHQRERRHRRRPAAILTPISRALLPAGRASTPNNPTAAASSVASNANPAGSIADLRDRDRHSPFTAAEAPSDSPPEDWDQAFSRCREPQAQHLRRTLLMSARRNAGGCLPKLSRRYGTMNICRLGKLRFTRSYFCILDDADDLCMSVVSPCLRCAMNLPIASRPRLNFLVNASFTIATFGDPSASATLNSRPATTGIPSVRKYPGPTSLKRELASMSGPRLNPCTATSLPNCCLIEREPALTIHRQRRELPRAPLPVARRTASIARRVAIQLWRDSNVTTRSIFRPRSTRLTLVRLLPNSPAAASSAIESATCATTSDVRNLAAEARAGQLARSGAKRRHEIGRVLCSAGKSPKSKPVPSERTAANTTTLACSEKCSVDAVSTGSSAVSRPRVRFATKEADDSAEHREQHRLA